MKEKIKIAVRVLAFFAVFCICFAALSRVFVRKTLYGPWNATVKYNAFRNLEEDSLDVIVFGSSHAYCSFVPKVLQDEYGIRAYVLATSEQPVAASYYFMLDALKTQNPKVIVLETYMVNNSGETPTDVAIYRATEQMPFSLNKLRMISALTDGKEDKVPFYLDLFEYHNRWDELTGDDFFHDVSEDRDEESGYVRLDGAVEVCPNEIADPTAASTIDPTDAEYLDKIIRLADERGIRLVFAYTPYLVDVKGSADLNATVAFAQSRGVPFADGYADFEKIGLNTATDFYDASHTNSSGAEKFTRYFAENFLSDLY